MRFTVDRLDHLVLTCTDVELVAAWYQRVLGMEREDFGPERRLRAEIRRAKKSMCARPMRTTG